MKNIFVQAMGDAMDIRSIRHVVALDRHHSYTKAAHELGITQPTLTRSIQSLEAGLKAKLFDRDRGQVRTTAFGCAFVERAHLVLQEFAGLEGLLVEAASRAHDISFGMAPLAAATLLAPIISENLAEKPEMRSKVAVRSVAALLDLLIEHEIEFFVAAEGQIPTTTPVQTSVLGWFSARLIVRGGHPLLHADPSTSIEDYPLVISRELDDPRMWVVEQLAGQPIVPTAVLEDHGTLLRIAESSDAIWLSSPEAVRDELRTGRLHVLPPVNARQVLRFRMLMYSLERRTLSPAARQLREQFRSSIKATAAPR